MGKLNAKQRQALPDNIFGIPEDRSYPMPDAKHVKSAISFFHKAPENKKKELAKNIARRVKELNIKVVGNCQYMRYLSPSKESSTGFNGLYGYNRIDESSTKFITMPNIKKNNGYTIKGGMVASLPKKNIDMNASNIGTLSPIVPLNQEPPLQQGPSIHEDYLDGELDDSMFVSDSEFADNVEDLIESLQHTVYNEENVNKISLNLDNKENFTLEDYQRELYSEIYNYTPNDNNMNTLSNKKLDMKIAYIMKIHELKDLYNYMTQPYKNRVSSYTNNYSVFGIYLRDTIIGILHSDIPDNEIVMKIVRLLPCSLKKDGLFWNLYPVMTIKNYDLFKKIIDGYFDKLIKVRNSNGTKLEDMIGSISEFNSIVFKDKPSAAYLNLDTVVNDNTAEKNKDRYANTTSYIGLASKNFPEYLLGKNKRFEDNIADLTFHIAFSARFFIKDALQDNYYVTFASPVYRTEDLNSEHPDGEWRYDRSLNTYEYDDLDLAFHSISNFRNVVNELYMNENYFINYPSFDELIPFTFYRICVHTLELHFFYMLRDRNNKSKVKICDYSCNLDNLINDNGRWKIRNIPIRYNKFPIYSGSPSFFEFRDFALRRETDNDIIVDNLKFYHDCDINDPKSLKAAIIEMARRSPDISDHYFKLIPDYKDIMTMNYLGESTSVVKEASVKKFMNRVKDTISGIEISDKGDIKIDLHDKLSFKHYEEIHSVLKENQKANNYEAMKENIAYIFTLINTLDSLYVDAGKGRHKKEIKKDDEYYEMMRLRALFISDFKTYLRVIQKHDPKFNFLEYYKNSPANHNTVTIKGTTIKKLGMLFKSIIL